MNSLTKRQQQIFDFIANSQVSQGMAPTLREIARRFGFRSMTAAADHVRALRRKGFLTHWPRQARASRVIVPPATSHARLIEIPVYGTIPAGFTQDQAQETADYLSLDAKAMGIRPGSRTFALRVRGDSMIGKHILEGDHVIMDPSATPRAGDVVAALIDGEDTLKTFVIEEGRPSLRAENPRYPAMIPARDLVIQGVMVGLLRSAAK